MRQIPLDPEIDAKIDALGDAVRSAFDDVMGLVRAAFNATHELHARETDRLNDRIVQLECGTAKLEAELAKLTVRVIKGEIDAARAPGGGSSVPSAQSQSLN
jgi:hypothetical protein